MCDEIPPRLPPRSLVKTQHIHVKLATWLCGSAFSLSCSYSPQPPPPGSLELGLSLPTTMSTRHYFRRHSAHQTTSPPGAGTSSTSTCSSSSSARAPPKTAAHPVLEPALLRRPGPARPHGLGDAVAQLHLRRRRRHPHERRAVGAGRQPH
jgi:hypothetical protein